MKIGDIIKRQNLIIGFVILFFGTIFARNVYRNQVKNVISLKEEIKQTEEKERILKEIQTLEKKIEGYKEKFVKKDVSSLIEEITKNAGVCNVKVSYIRPETEIITENFVEQPMSMELLGNYHNLGKFLALLEKNIQIKIQEIRSSKVEGEKEDLRNSISVSSISFK